MKTSQTFQIPVGRIQEVSAYLVKLQKRAKKINEGVEVFTFSFEGKINSRVFRVENEDGGVSAEAIYQYRNLIVEQDIIVHEGWVPIAKILIPEKQIKSFNTFTKEMEKLSDEYLYNTHCDHCNKNLIKVKSFVMQKGTELMKVGSGCMHQLAPASARMIAASFDIGQMWQAYLNSMNSPVDGEGGSRKWFGGGGGFDANIVFDKNEVLTALGNVLADDGGWVTSEYRIEEGRWGMESKEIINRGKRTFDHIGFALSRDIVSQLPNPEFIASVNSAFEIYLGSDVANKLVDIVETDSTTAQPKVVGKSLPELTVQAKSFVEANKIRLIDIFLVKRVMGAVERINIKNSKRGSEYVGEKGTKIALEVNILDTKTGMGEYGSWTMYIFKDASGNLFKKFGSTINERFKMEDGKYKFLAPVKGHEVYDDIKYTVLGGPFAKVKEPKKMKVA